MLAMCAMRKQGSIVTMGDSAAHHAELSSEDLYSQAAGRDISALSREIVKLD